MTQLSASDFFATNPSRLTPDDVAQPAAEHGLTPAHILAIADVEGSGAGFLADHRPKILFEAKTFSGFTNHQFDQSHPNVSSPTWNRSLYRGGGAE